METGSLLSLLIYVLIVGVIGWLIYYVIGALIPNPPARIIQIVIAVLIAIVLLIKIAATFGVAI